MLARMHYFVDKPCRGRFNGIALHWTEGVMRITAFASPRRSCVRSWAWLLAGAAGVFLAIAPNRAGAAVTFLGPSPYLQTSDSPFISDINAGRVALETFEDGLLNVPGVPASTGVPIGPGGNIDSVDGDDGNIDGSGTAGHSFFDGNGAGGITFTF